MEVDGVELSNQDAISNPFSNFFRGLMGESAPAFDIGVNWEQIYPAGDRALLHDL